MLSTQQKSLKNWLNYAFSYFSIDIFYKLPEVFIFAKSLLSMTDNTYRIQPVNIYHFLDYFIIIVSIYTFLSFRLKEDSLLKANTASCLHRANFLLSCEHYSDLIRGGQCIFRLLWSQWNSCNTANEIYLQVC